MIFSQKKLTEHQLQKYIDEMLHSCRYNVKLHPIGTCEDRIQVSSKLVRSYYARRWSPTIFGEKKDEWKENEGDKKILKTTRSNLFIHSGQERLPAQSISQEGDY